MPSAPSGAFVVGVEPVSEESLDSLGEASDVAVVEDELAREVGAERLARDATVGERDRVPEADRFAAAAGRPCERAAERVRRAPRLARGILDRRLARSCRS